MKLFFFCASIAIFASTNNAFCALKSPDAMYLHIRRGITYKDGNYVIPEDIAEQYKVRVKYGEQEKVMVSNRCETAAELKKAVACVFSGLNKEDMKYMKLVYDKNKRVIPSRTSLAFFLSNDGWEPDRNNEETLEFTLERQNYYKLNVRTDHTSWTFALGRLNNAEPTGMDVKRKIMEIDPAYKACVGRALIGMQLIRKGKVLGNEEYVKDFMDTCAPDYDPCPTYPDNFCLELKER